MRIREFIAGVNVAGMLMAFCPTHVTPGAEPSQSSQIHEFVWPQGTHHSYEPLVRCGVRTSRRTT